MIPISTSTKAFGLVIAALVLGLCLMAWQVQSLKKSLYTANQTIGKHEETIKAKDAAIAQHVQTIADQVREIDRISHELDLSNAVLAKVERDKQAYQQETNTLKKQLRDLNDENKKFISQHLPNRIVSMLQQLAATDKKRDSEDNTASTTDAEDTQAESRRYLINDLMTLVINYDSALNSCNADKAAMAEWSNILDG